MGRHLRERQTPALVGESDMSNQRFRAELKEEAEHQVNECGHGVTDVAERLGVSSHIPYSSGLKAVKNEQQAQELIDKSGSKDLDISK